MSLADILDSTVYKMNCMLSSLVMPNLAYDAYNSLSTFMIYFIVECIMFEFTAGYVLYIYISLIFYFEDFLIKKLPYKNILKM